jgi:hypothetical protein
MTIFKNDKAKFTAALRKKRTYTLLYSVDKCCYVYIRFIIVCKIIVVLYTANLCMYIYDFVPHPTAFMTHLWIHGMYVSMYVCMFVRIYVHTYIRMHVGR